MVACETRLKRRRESDHDRWMEKTRRPHLLSICDRVAVQNQHGNNPRKWERVGTVVSTEDYDRYGIRLDGSRQLSIRNWKHLRQVSDSTPRRDMVVMPPQPPTSHHQIQPETRPVEERHEVVQPSPDPDKQETVQPEPEEKGDSFGTTKRDRTAATSGTGGRTPRYPDNPRQAREIQRRKDPEI